LSRECHHANEQPYQTNPDSSLLLCFHRKGNEIVKTERLAMPADAQGLESKMTFIGFLLFGGRE
jgi:hypothetical protein